MRSVAVSAALCVAGLALAASASLASTGSTNKSTPASSVTKSTAASSVTKSAPPVGHDIPQHATFGLGCFWSGEVTFEGRPGVISVTSGYTGGTKPNPTYEEVGTRTTGHYESVDIVFDPARTSYERLLDIFWHNVDPTQGDGQFCDHGPEYRSAIFYHGESQHQLALAAEKEIEASHQIRKPIVTQILPASAFYRAEDYHQDFYRKNSEYYHQYRTGCGRDARLLQLWGKLDAYAPGVE